LERALGLFAKWPASGRAKTRLADSADPAWAARVARAFLLDAVHRLAAVNARRVLAFTPPDREADFAAVAAGRFELTPQTDGDLGRRMAAFVHRQVMGGARSVVLVGADSPTLPLEYVERAFAELERCDVVIGPAADGGYYLIGCGPRHPPLFEGVAWGTARVLEDTVAALADPCWRLAMLPPWYDVDTPQDWAMLRGHLAALRRAGADANTPHLDVLLREASAPSGPSGGEGP
jgi:rSAM/selenodomain-associated transferase 1